MFWLSFSADLSRLSSDDQIPDDVKRAAKGALWVLEGKDEQHRISSAESEYICRFLLTKWCFRLHKSFAHPETAACKYPTFRDIPDAVMHVCVTSHFHAIQDPSAQMK